MLLGWFWPSSLSATIVFVLTYTRELSCLKCKVTAREYSTFKDCVLQRFLCGSGWLTSNPVGPRLCYSTDSVFALESLHTIFIVIICPLSFLIKIQQSYWIISDIFIRWDFYSFALTLWKHLNVICRINVSSVFAVWLFWYDPGCVPVVRVSQGWKTEPFLKIYSNTLDSIK